MTFRPNLPSVEEMYIAAAVRHLAAARNHLQCAVLRFDDAGYEHDPTARSYSFVAGIVAGFGGRPWCPVPQPEPSQDTGSKSDPVHIEEAAVEWRRQAKRSY